MGWSLIMGFMKALRSAHTGSTAASQVAGKGIICLLAALMMSVGCVDSKVVIDATNVRSILTNGTPRAIVLEMFGTNVVSTPFHGMENMIYFFEFTGRPKNVSPRLYQLGLVISNDVVFDIRYAYMKPDQSE